MVGWQQFVASLVASIAWPSALIITAFVFREPIIQAINRTKRLSFSGLNAEFYESLRAVGELTEKRRKKSHILVNRDVINDFLDLAKVSPRGSILEAWLEIEKKLLQITCKNNIEMAKEYENLHGKRLARKAYNLRLIGKDDLYIIERLADLRNAAVHDHSNELKLEQAEVFVNSVWYILDSIDSRQRTED